MTTEIDRHVFVIFGGTGDLARRKLIPSLYRLITENGIADRCILLGVAPGELDDDAYRAWTRDALGDTGLSDADLEAWCDTTSTTRRLGAAPSRMRSFAAGSSRSSPIEISRETVPSIWLSPHLCSRPRSRASGKPG